MTVKDFKEVLEKYNEDDEVLFWDVLGECYQPLWEGQLYFKEKK